MESTMRFAVSRKRRPPSLWRKVSTRSASAATPMLTAILTDVIEEVRSGYGVEVRAVLQ